MEDEKEQAPELFMVHAAGCIPGIPGYHSPGLYTIDRVNRTLTPFPATEDQHTNSESAAKAEHLDEEIQQLEAERSALEGAPHTDASA